MVREICTQSVEPDGIGFDPTSVRVVPIAEEAEYDGVSVQFQGRLDTIRLHMQLDFGFGDQVFPKPERSGYPTIFDMPAPSLLTYSRETAIAEKLHVIFVREQLNSRMKDYFDIWWLASQFQFDGEQLAEAIRRTCQQRKTEIPSHPVGLSQDLTDDPTKITQWRAFRRRRRVQSVVRNEQDRWPSPIESRAAGDATGTSGTERPILEDSSTCVFWRERRVHLGHTVAFRFLRRLSRWRNKRAAVFTLVPAGECGSAIILDYTP